MKKTTNVMFKDKIVQVAIRSCNKCPNMIPVLMKKGITKKCFASGTLYRTITRANPIPDWCPLPDAPEDWNVNKIVSQLIQFVNKGKNTE